jgi:hypothetical protein
VKGRKSIKGVGITMINGVYDYGLAVRMRPPFLALKRRKKKKKKTKRDRLLNASAIDLAKKLCTREGWEG